MSLMSPVSCVSDAFYLYRVYFFWIYCNFYHSTNHILSMIILTMMGMDPGPLVRAFSLFALMNPLVVLTIMLVVSVAWGLEFLSRKESSQLVTVFRWSYLHQKESIPKAVDSYKYFGA